ncbi:nucleotidyltransferase domain-containing protein [Chitiniphilus purpureus]|uniref:Nucleotidyltransferase domain-containing protein n=1 Tax=Chitiniphilus purpureus TaxID=2981137 RepID=A0ABY6DNZ2_9NEIS|nr:nucleotidyltransferase domain-containing protein [Chitiniphilus sp. CD1]UXY16104.1 nucleotidyltransferase domain-containing protein [Chitiniphilus sp. CD1]
MAKTSLLDRSATSLRLEIAHRAARLIAQDHIHDFALAKKKAARQLGLSDHRNLPSNQEVEEALADHRALYQPTHGHEVQTLRSKAVKVMRVLADFQPYLTGSVLSGLADAQSDINLLLFLDDPKSVELFLLNERIDYAHLEPSPTQRFADHPTLAFWFDDTLIKLHVRPRTAERLTPRKDERARVEQVEQLLAASR